MRKKISRLNLWRSEAYKLLINFVVLIFLFCATSTAIANSSEYCANTSSHAKKIIESYTPDVGAIATMLEQNLSIVYEFALFSTKNAVKLKKNQCDWLKKKELCQDVDCIMATNKNRMRELIAIIDGHPNKPADSENSDLKGLWYGADRAAHAIYGTLLITDSVIIWGGEKSVPNPYYKTTYSIEKEPFGVSFQDQIGGTYVFNEKSQFKTYKLKLKPSKDVAGLTYLRFTLPSKIQNYADVIEYDKNHPTGYIHFHKR